MATIVFIDDEAPLRRVLAAELRDAGHDVIEASNGRDGLAAILENQPDLILCDVNMPTVSGYDVLTELRAKQTDPIEAPFIFLSALADRLDVVAGKKLGADDYLTKPVDIDVLLATVDSRLAQVARLDRKYQTEKSRMETEWRRVEQVQQAARDHLMQLFSSHVSATVAQELWRHHADGDANLQPRTRPLTATILFCDIDNFTAVSEQLDLDSLVRWLNGCMEALVDCVSRSGGVVNKFMGDAVMAVFGVPVPRTTEAEMDGDAAAAAACAMAMEGELRRLNQIWRAEGLPAVTVSTGIETGMVMAGNIGGIDRVEYTVIGDAVNIAARLEAVAKDLSQRDDATVQKILVGQAAWARLGDRYRGVSVGPIVLKGKSSAIEVYRLLGDAELGS